MKTIYTQHFDSMWIQLSLDPEDYAGVLFVSAISCGEELHTTMDFYATELAVDVVQKAIAVTKSAIIDAAMLELQQLVDVGFHAH